ncbi:MAG TPA: class I SAM-dependent methyltransferase [Halothiobacillus sp.]|nr:MAG: hypothetical protein B7Z82_05005 [Halothiobacillus sp. 20-54-6]HQT43861.1 class I SAM-dependent methyltransferase [Halothiobacillus sp.]
MEMRPIKTTVLPTESLSDWYRSPIGARVGQDLVECIGRRVDDAFGYHAVILGAALPMYSLSSPSLAARLRIRCVTQVASTPVDLPPVVQNSTELNALPAVMGVVADYAELPIDSAAADLVIALHVLENRREPHELLREIDRMVHPEGRLLIGGINPMSLWHGQRWFRSGCHAALAEGWHHAAWRVVDWLRVLGYDVLAVEHIGGVCPICRPRFFQNMRAMRQWSQSWVGFLQGFYVIDAVRRVSTPTAIRPTFRLKTLLPNKARAQVAGKTAVGGPVSGKISRQCSIKKSIPTLKNNHR